MKKCKSLLNLEQIIHISPNKKGQSTEVWSQHNQKAVLKIGNQKAQQIGLNLSHTTKTICLHNVFKTMFAACLFQQPLSADFNRQLSVIYHLTFET